MAKSKVLYSCQDCGASQSKWSGQCQSCEGWNTLVEELDDAAPTQGLRKGISLAFTDLSSVCENPPRFLSNITEFDRVCGGGLVAGSVVLVGGDPGIGKSTLLLQVAARLSKNLGVYYISGEEAINQVRMRAERLKVKDSKVHLAAATSLNDIITSLEGAKAGVVIIDSIQTMHADSISAAPGSVSQVRFCTQALIRFAKKRNIIVIIVGHVTKEGTIAGPRVLEHMVDAVLYFEGERGHQFRILRGVKNRFGATDEIGVFEMTQEGLQEVLNPSSLFISERDEQISGSAVFAGIEGTRPLLLEVQALVAPSAFGTPRRAVVGWDNNRLAMLLAVLETRCGVNLGNRDVYLNVAGGLRIQEPAADLAVAAALMSALTDQALPKASLFCGEVGLSGEVRGVTHLEARLKEAQKLGFESAYIPTQGSSKIKTTATKSLEVMRLGTLQELASFFNTTSQNTPRNQPNSNVNLPEEPKDMDNGFLANISYVDLIIAGGLLLFIIMGIIRGFTNDILSLMTWVGAFLTTSIAFPYLQPFIRTFIKEPFFGDIVLGFLVFILSLTLLVFIAKTISNQVRKSVLSGLDRTLGIVSGFFRGTILLTVVYFMALMFWKPGATPETFQQARLIPYINTSAQLVHQFLIPDEFFPKRLLRHMYGKDSVAQDPLSSEDLVKSLSSPKAGSTKKEKEQKTQTPIEKGYKNLERKALENLIDHVAPKSE